MAARIGTIMRKPLPKIEARGVVSALIKGLDNASPTSPYARLGIAGATFYRGETAKNQIATFEIITIGLRKLIVTGNRAINYVLALLRPYGNDVYAYGSNQFI